MLQVWGVGGGKTSKVVRTQQVAKGESLSGGDQDLTGACLLLVSVLVSAPQNGILRGVYPGSPTSWLAVVMATVGTSYCNLDISNGLVYYIQKHLPER